MPPNYCINKTMNLELQVLGNHKEYQPGWTLTPMSDKYKNPVGYIHPSLPPFPTNKTAGSAFTFLSDRGLTCKRLIEAIDVAVFFDFRQVANAGERSQRNDPGTF
jgi:hypothetical protein